MKCDAIVALLKSVGLESFINNKIILNTINE